jgi:signal-transduction protein with cAMP-binding, CBS, and nucleotidyltransferase domain
VNIQRQNEKVNAMLEVQQRLKDYQIHKDECVYIDDNPNGDLYWLDEGHVDIIMNDQKVYSVKNHGDIFGELSAYGNGNDNDNKNDTRIRRRQREYYGTL